MALLKSELTADVSAEISAARPVNDKTRFTCKIDL